MYKSTLKSRETIAGLCCAFSVGEPLWGVEGLRLQQGGRFITSEEQFLECFVLAWDFKGVQLFFKVS